MLFMRLMLRLENSTLYLCVCVCGTYSLPICWCWRDVSKRVRSLEPASVIIIDCGRLPKCIRRFKIEFQLFMTFQPVDMGLCCALQLSQPECEPTRLKPCSYRSRFSNYKSIDAMLGSRRHTNVSYILRAVAGTGLRSNMWAARAMQHGHAPRQCYSESCRKMLQRMQLN